MIRYDFKRGRHYADGAFCRLITGWWFDKGIICGEFQFTKELWYPEPANCALDDMNKLVGVGFGFNHHKNSVRINWRPDYKYRYYYFLYGYMYDNGKWKKKDLCRVRLGKNAYVIDWSNPKEYKIVVNASHRMRNKFDDKYNWGHYLYPYIGGDNVAERDCSLLLSIK